MKKSKQFGGVLSALTLAAVMAFMTGAKGEEVIDIDSLDKLQKIGEDEEFPLDGHYILTSDIRPSSQEDFEPIGDFANRFTGVFDGNGHVITGLSIHRPGNNYVGLFGYVGDGGEVRNVVLKDCEITGGRAVGGLVGQNAGTISESHANVEVAGDQYVGGLIGWNEGKVAESHATGTVEGEERVGGLVGEQEEGGKISNSYAIGDVSGIAAVGGLVGRNFQGQIEETFATGTVTGEGHVGGLIGVNAGPSAKVSNSYATGTVDGKGGNRVGGLIGYVTYYSKVINSYSVGEVSGGTDVGGLVGERDGRGEVTASFWDITTSGQEESAGGDGVQGKITDDMQDKSTFTDAGWNFDDIWAIDEGTYPYLINNPPEVFGDVTGSGSVGADDLQAVINAVLGLDVDADYEPDVNGDGSVDALDVQLVILVLLGLLG